MYYDCLKVWSGKSGCLASDPNSDTCLLSLYSNSAMYQQYNLKLHIIPLVPHFLHLYNEDNTSCRMGTNQWGKCLEKCLIIVKVQSVWTIITVVIVIIPFTNKNIFISLYCSHNIKYGYFWVIGLRLIFSLLIIFISNLSTTNIYCF